MIRKNINEEINNFIFMIFPFIFNTERIQPSVIAER